MPDLIVMESINILVIEDGEGSYLYDSYGRGIISFSD